MSNCEIFNLPAVEVEPHQIREVLRCALHTIIFNRALGFVRPRDVDSELFEITYVQCGDAAVDQKLEQKITEFCNFAEKRPGETAQLSLLFYEKKRKQVGWFGTHEDRLYWEQWCINILVTQPDIVAHGHMGQSNAAAARRAKLQAAVEDVMAAIVRGVNDKKDHIPPVVSSDTVTFPFDITISGGSRSMFGLAGIKKMMLHTMPPQVLQ